MKVEIIGSGNPSNDLLQVYAHNTRPYATIYEDDFCELLTDAQIEKMYNGKIVFDVNKSKLIELSKQVFHNNF